MFRRASPGLLLVLGAAAPLMLLPAFLHSPTSGLLALVTTFALHALLLYGTLRPNNRLFGPVQTRCPAPCGNEIWLTIDDGPDPHDTPRLLDLLDAAGGAKATFFVVGARVRAHPELAREIVRRGHALGNHTDTHPQATFWCLGPGRLRREIGRCNDAIRAATGTAPRLFRAPVGMVNPCVPPAVRAAGLRLVGWSARGFDGVSTADPAEVVRRILADLRPGGIVLLHEGKRGPAGESINVRALERLIPALRERGWRPVLPPTPPAGTPLLEP